MIRYVNRILALAPNTFMKTILQTEMKEAPKHFPIQCEEKLLERETLSTNFIFPKRDLRISRNIYLLSNDALIGISGIV